MRKTAPDGDFAGELPEVTNGAHPQTTKDSEHSLEERDSTAEAAGAGTTAETGAAQGDTEQPPSAALAGKSELDIEEAERFAASFRPSWEPDAPPTPVIPPAQFVGASGGAARVIRHSTRSDLSAPKLRKRRGAAYAILGASLLGVAGVLYMAIASSSVRPSAELARLTDSTETRIEAMKAPQPAAAPAQPAAAATAEPTAPNAQAAAVDPNAQPGAADPNAQPVDPNAQPVSPNAQPVSPNAQLAAVSPNAQPVDPNAQIAAVDPNTQAAAPSAQAVGPNAPAAAANPSAVHAGTDPNAQATNAAAIPSAEPNAPVAAANPSAAHAGTNPNAPAVAAAPSAQPVTAPPSNPTAVRPGTNATTAEGQSGVPDIKTPEAAGGALAAAKTATPLPRMPSPQPQAAAERRAPDKASQVLLSLAAHPPSTKLRLDGVPIENPFRGRLPRSSKHRIEARAPGYAPEVHAVRLENDVQLMISLKRDPPANVKPDPYRDQRRAAAAAQSTPPRNRGAGFVSENPY